MTPEQQAYQKAYRQRPYVKAWFKARDQTPERKAYEKARDRRAYNKAYHQTPEFKMWFKSYVQTPAMKAYYKNFARHRKEAPFTWQRVSPWPTDCMICGLSFEGAYPDSRSETIGHEPPIAWMLRHPDYEGDLVLRPEHLSCNVRKQARPDWEIT